MYTIRNQALFNLVYDYLCSVNSNTYFIHSDILHGFDLKLDLFSRNNLLEAHYNCLNKLTNNANLWFPTFNLDFPKTKIYDIKNTPSQMGVLSEYARTTYCTWRTQIPMHSVSGTGSAPINMDVSDPWSHNSIFSALTKSNGTLLFYGTDISAISYLHFLERTFQVPYRYTKNFSGAIIQPNGESLDVTTSHIVRPVTFDLTYNWHKLNEDLLANQVILTFQDKRTKVSIINTVALNIFWAERLTEDPFYLLSPESRKWAENKIKELGHNFNIADFEK